MSNGDAYTKGNPTGFIRSAINEGLGPTEALSLFRSGPEPGVVTDARWFELYQMGQNAVNDRPDALGLDPFSIPPPDQYETWAFGRGGQYATQVEVTVYDQDTGSYLTKQYTYTTSEPHTPYEAETNALNDFGSPDVEAGYDETVYGAVATSFAQTVPYGTI